MAEIIDTEEFNIQAIAQHLRKGPFAPIFDQSSEKDDRIALKLMCVIDYETQRWELNKRMLDADSKLLVQLMRFHSYGTFKYYDYQVCQEVEKRALKCKFCELIGPYGYILTHMAINHNEHIPLKTCAYCNCTDLKKHFGDGTLHQCFANYLQINAIEWDEKVCDIVAEFYDALKGLSEKFKIKTIRTFAGRGSDSKDISACLVALDQEFNRVISYLYGGNDASRLLQQSINSNSNGNDDTIIISDDDDDEDEADGSNDATNSNRSFSAATSSDSRTHCNSLRLRNASEGTTANANPDEGNIKSNDVICID